MIKNRKKILICPFRSIAMNVLTKTAREMKRNHFILAVERDPATIVLSSFPFHYADVPDVFPVLKKAGNQTTLQHESSV